MSIRGSQLQPMRRIQRIHFVGVRQWLPGNENTTVTEWQANRKMGRVNPDSFLRLNAFRQAMDQLGLPVTEGRIHFEKRTEGGMRQIQEKLWNLGPQGRPQGVLCL